MQKRTRDGFQAVVYDDGSIGFNALAPGVERSGVNERLYEQYRIGRLRGFEVAENGRSVLNAHYVNVVTSSAATSLDFTKISGPGVPAGDNLILDSWTWGIRPQDATRLMRRLGFNVTGRNIRAAFDRLVALGWAAGSRKCPPKAGKTDYWVDYPSALRFQRVGIHTIHRYTGSASERQAAYVDLFEAFVPFLKVADCDLPREQRPAEPYIPRSHRAAWR